MVTIKLNPNSFTVTGHAGYDVAGKDIVCAGISSLVYSFIESVDSKNTVDAGNVECHFPTTPDTLSKYSMLVTGLQLLADSYPENVVIE